MKFLLIKKFEHSIYINFERITKINLVPCGEGDRFVLQLDYSINGNPQKEFEVFIISEERAMGLRDFFRTRSNLYYLPTYSWEQHEIQEIKNESAREEEQE
jgi:hypothetical protein